MSRSSSKCRPAPIPWRWSGKRTRAAFGPRDKAPPPLAQVGDVLIGQAPREVDLTDMLLGPLR